MPPVGLRAGSTVDPGSGLEKEDISGGLVAKIGFRNGKLVYQESGLSREMVFVKATEGS